MRTKLYILAISLFVVTPFIHANSCKFFSNGANQKLPQYTTMNQLLSVSKTLVKTFAMKDYSTIVINLDGKVIVKEWSEKTMRIHMDITLKNSSTHMLKHLISKGRYHINLEKEKDNFIVSSNARAKKVIVSKDGNTLDEVVKYTIFVPKNITVINKALVALEN